MKPHPGQGELEPVSPALGRPDEALRRRSVDLADSSSSNAADISSSVTPPRWIAVVQRTRLSEQRRPVGFYVFKTCEDTDGIGTRRRP